MVPPQEIVVSSGIINGVFGNMLMATNVFDCIYKYAMFIFLSKHFEKYLRMTCIADWPMCVYANLYRPHLLSLVLVSI